MEPLSVADGSAFPAKELGTFDVTVANILAEPIMRLEPVFAHFTRPGDVMVTVLVVTPATLGVALGAY